MGSTLLMTLIVACVAVIYAHPFFPHRLLNKKPFLMKRREYFPRPTPFNPHLLSIPQQPIIIVDGSDLYRDNLGGLDLGNSLAVSGNVQVVGFGNDRNGYDNGQNGYGNRLNGGNGYDNGGNGYRNGGNGYENGGNGYGNGGNGYSNGGIGGNGYEIGGNGYRNGGNDYGNGGIIVGNDFTNGGNVGVLPKVVNANTNVGVEQDYPVVV